MPDRNIGNAPLTISLSVAGIISGFLSIWLMPLGYFLGGVFGVAIAICLALSGILRNAWKLALVVSVSVVSYVLSIFGVFLIEAANRMLSQPPAHEHQAISTAALAMGGILGAYLLLGATVRITAPEIVNGSFSVQLLLWSLSGGLLGAIGWVLGPSLGAGIQSTLHNFGLLEFRAALYSKPENWYSLLIVWQSGIGLVLGLLLRKRNAHTSEGGN